MKTMSAVCLLALIVCSACAKQNGVNKIAPLEGKQPVRFAIYDAGKLISYDPNQRKGNPSIQAVLKETGDAVLIKSDGLELRALELLQPNLSNVEIEAKKKQVIEEESVRQRQSFHSADKHTRKLVETIRSAVYEAMGNNADITVDLDEVYFGLDKIKGSGVNVTKQIQNHFEIPDTALSLNKQPEPIDVSVGFFSFEKLQESSPLLKKIHEDAIDKGAKLLAVARLDLSEYNRADASGLSGDRLSDFKQKKMDHMVASQKLAAEIGGEQGIELNRIVRLAATKVAREKNLDVVVNMDGVAVKPEFESKVMIGVTNEILVAVAEVTSAPKAR